MRVREAAREVVRCCRSLWEAGLIAGADGNVSVKLGPDRVLVTPRGVLKSELNSADLVEVDMAGLRLRGYREATTELDLHLRVYRRREDCGAVVHAHPPTATGFAVVGQGLPGDVLPEIALLLGDVPCVPYSTAGTRALGNAVEPFLDRHVALLFANHGALTWGKDLTEARIRMESLEHGARILFAARALGGVNRLTRDQIDVLERMRGNPSHGQNDGY
ncbi:MAG TPA: class II aldolase/adducin family protein [Gemmatimonadales bacterium]|nr:class II aldolase/adducin family protein [Gemmatimonadales bacterium]